MYTGIMDFTVTVNVSVERTEGKFATKEELREQIMEAIEAADPQTLEGENGGQYSITTWDVEETS
jgi:hypothetical protein